MRKYLATIHTRSPYHKKRFAFLVSGGFTLLIFGVWSLATFGTAEKTVTKNDNEFSPLESLKASVSTAFRVLRSDVDEVEKGLETVNQEYGR